MDADLGEGEKKIQRKKLLFIFVDGIGLGKRDARDNPCARFSARILKLFSSVAPGDLPREGKLLASDPTLGVPGIPQSATGQASLFTGINAAKIVGRHLQGFPNGVLRSLIAKRSIFRQLKSRGLTATFANVYTPRFFEKRPRWVSVTTVMCETAGISLRTLAHLQEGKGLFMDFTNRFLMERGFEIELLSPSAASQVLVGLASEFDFSLYEFFLTDLIGHRGTIQDAAALLAELDEFLYQVVQNLDLSSTSLIITSDHGNIEDMATSQHTRNRVPTLVWGDIKGHFPASTDLCLEDITPRIVRFLA